MKTNTHINKKMIDDVNLNLANLDSIIRLEIKDKDSQFPSINVIFKEDIFIGYRSTDAHLSKNFYKFIENQFLKYDITLSFNNTGDIFWQANYNHDSD